MKTLALSVLFFISVAELAMSAVAPAPRLDPAYAAKALGLSIHCTQETKPHLYDRYCEGEGCGNPKEKHPAFFGCFDWHSAVHGHWAMLRVLHAFPELPEAKQALAILNRHLTKANLEKELAYFKGDRLFERPYGWAWYLRLSEEVSRSTRPEAAGWAEALKPLETHLVGLTKEFLANLSRPSRVGTHSNTAYALIHMRDYAVAKGDTAFLALIDERSRALYGKDRNCPLAYEPSEGDFVSPCFTEADLMRRVLPAKEFATWFNGFLPKIAADQLKPVVPRDIKDYILGHMIGLMYQKASAMSGVAASLPARDSRRALLEKASLNQAATAWGLMFDSGYGGTHWLASFAIYYYDRIGIPERR